MEYFKFDLLLKEYKEGKISLENNIIKEKIEPPLEGDIKELPLKNSSNYEEMFNLGKKAILNNEVGVIVLAGGMATRFAYNRPKALFPIYRGKTFLELKVLDCIKWNLPLYIMTSFFSHDLIVSLFEKNNYWGMDKNRVKIFKQYQLPRIYLDGTVVKDESGNIDYAAAGHGDFIYALKNEGLLDEFINNGGKYFLFSNIDNLGAQVEPLILGNHILSNKPMTIEVASKIKGDKGGAPARVNNRLQLVEGFCFPKNFDQDSINVFNTATYIFTAKDLIRDFNLPWYVVVKKIKNKEIIQFEHLAGDLTRFLDGNYIKVNREERFLPVKTIDDVPYVRSILDEHKFMQN